MVLIQYNEVIRISQPLPRTAWTPSATPGASMGATSELPTTSGVPERLVLATIKLLAEQGPSAIKARTVATEAGMSTMVVYSHFGGVPELIRAVVDHGYFEMETALSRVPITDDPIAD